MQRLYILLLSVAISQIAFAGEPRWCSVSSRDPSNSIVYPPISAAAEVQGEARARIIYKPNGRVERVESVSGVPMLLMPLTSQLSKWTVRSNASGDELCQTLVIAMFTLRKPAGAAKQKIKFIMEPNAIRMYISRHRGKSYQVSDPAVAVRQAFSLQGND